MSIHVIRMLKQFNNNYNHFSYLRSVMVVVSQEPVLFDVTTMDNIQFGREDATKEQIEQAAKESNVHNY